MNDLYSQLTFSLMSYKQNVESEDTQWSDDTSFYHKLISDSPKTNRVNLYEIYKLIDVMRSFKENDFILKFFSTYYKTFTELKNDIKLLTEKISNLNVNSNYSIPLSAIYSEKWELSKPIHISIEKNSDEDFIACLYEADIYGYGNSIPDSIEDFINNLINQYEYLLDERVSLGELPKRQLLVLNQLIKGK